MSAAAAVHQIFFLSPLSFLSLCFFPKISGISGTRSLSRKIFFRKKRENKENHQHLSFELKNENDFRCCRWWWWCWWSSLVFGCKKMFISIFFPLRSDHQQHQWFEFFFLVFFLFEFITVFVNGEFHSIFGWKKIPDYIMMAK